MTGFETLVYNDESGSLGTNAKVSDACLPYKAYIPMYCHNPKTTVKDGGLFGDNYLVRFDDNYLVRLTDM